jgi:hypothetical protein
VEYLIFASLTREVSKVFLYFASVNSILYNNKQEYCRHNDIFAPSDNKWRISVICNVAHVVTKYTHILTPTEKCAVDLGNSLRWVKLIVF